MGSGHCWSQGPTVCPVEGERAAMRWPTPGLRGPPLYEEDGVPSLGLCGPSSFVWIQGPWDFVRGAPWCLASAWLGGKDQLHA